MKISRITLVVGIDTAYAMFLFWGGAACQMGVGKPSAADMSYAESAMRCLSCL